MLRDRSNLYDSDDLFLGLLFLGIRILPAVLHGTFTFLFTYIMLLTFLIISLSLTHVPLSSREVVQFPVNTNSQWTS